MSLMRLLRLARNAAEQGCSGALRGGCGIVKLVRQISGQLTESRELFSLLLNARDFADAVEQRGDNALRHGGDGREHFRENRAMNQQRPDRRDGESLAAVALHAREGQQAGHLPGAADKQRHGAAVLAAHMNLAFEDEDHVLGRSAFLEENVARIGDVFLAVTREPQTIFKRKAVERADVIDGFRDFFKRRGSGGSDDGGGKHPGPPSTPTG